MLIRVFSCLFLCLSGLGAGAQNLPDPIAEADYRPLDINEARLGQLLFYDPVLSGNGNVACASCHHPDFGTSDGVSLSFGDGGLGLGPTRRADPDNAPEDRIPRNAPGLFNLGATEFTVLFHDGRIETDPDRPGGLRTPMDEDMLAGFASLLSAQTMFPVLSRDEMAGGHRENPIGRAVRQGVITGPGGAWNQIAQRVTEIPAYADAFVALYPHIAAPQDVSFADISNAVAAFMAFEWRSDTSPFDAVLRGEAQLQGAAARGMALFYGPAGCADCHAGKYLTDHGFHAMAAPQIGPGKAASFLAHQRDEGRFGVTGQAVDLYAFRTPSLRNVALTAPYGHAGSHADLARFVADHTDPVAAIERYDPAMALLPDPQPEDFTVMSDPSERAAIAAAVTRPPVAISDGDLAGLVKFLHTLTDPVAISGRLGIPAAVPSGLPLPSRD